MKKLSAPMILVAVFVTAFFTLRACDAEASEASVELGAAHTGEFNGGAGLIYSERFAGKWDIGIMMFSDQKFYSTTLQENGGLFAQRIASRGKFSMGVGVARWMNTSRIIGCEFGFALSFGYEFRGNWTANIRHWSNGGACRPNHGQDLITIGYRFGSKP